jgi:hypothetical protein
VDNSSSSYNHISGERFWNHYLSVLKFQSIMFRKVFMAPMQDLRFSHRWLWTVLFRIQRCVVCWRSTNVSEDQVGSIFGVEE